jgi:hypothetical protein
MITMKQIILSAVIIFFSFYVQSQDNQLTPEEFAEGWVLLFDGETLNGWKAYNGHTPKTWSVNENSIYCDGSKGGDDLMTIEHFGDFDLKFEWKIEEKGNSGVIYRAREGKQWGQPYLTGPEYQVHDETENFSKTSVGSVYDVYAPSKNKKVNSAMQWNSGRIRIINGLLTHWVNGDIVVQCKINSDEWNKKVAESKWKDNRYYAKSPFGHIDFQNHGYRVWFKNVKILRL